MSTMERTKIKRSDFEHKLVDLFGGKNIYASPYAERGIDSKGNEKYTKMTLYYLKTGNKHLGTWCKGEGWIF